MSVTSTAPDSPPRAAGVEPEADWSGHTIVRQRLGTAGATIFTGGALVHMLWAGAMPVFQLSVALVGLSLFGLSRFEGTAPTTRSRGMIACLIALVVLVLIHSGYSPVFSASFVMLVICTGLLAGRLAMGIVTVAILALFVGLGRSVETGSLHFAELGRDPNLWTNWLRVTLFYSAVWFVLHSIIAGVAQFLTRAEAHLRQRQRVVDASRQEMATVRSARIEAEQQLGEGQRRASVNRIGRGLGRTIHAALQGVREQLNALPASPSPSERQAISTAVRSVLQPSLEVIHDLVTLSKPTVRPPLTAIDLDQPVAIACRSVQASQLGADTHLESRLLGGLQVAGRPDLIQQAVLNLLFNALESTPSGTIQVTTDYAPARDGIYTHALVVVEDTGSGIRPDVLAQVVEPFFSTRSGQTGLGLSVVHAIAQQAGGDLELRSTVGVGTHAALALPLAQPVPQADVASRADRPSSRWLHSPEDLAGLRDRYALAPLPPKPLDSPVELSTWRLDFARRLNRGMGWAVGLLTLVHLCVSPPLHPSTYIVTGPYVLLTLYAGYGKTASPAVVYATLLYGPWFASLVVLVFNSFTNPVAITGLTTALCWGVLLGRKRSTWIMLVGAATAFLAAGWVRQTLSPQPMSDNLDPNLGVTWYRMAPQLLLQMGVIGVTVVGVLARLKRGTEQQAAALEETERLRLEEAREASRLIALEAQRALQERMQVTRQLAGALAHDLRNTLQLVYNIELIEDEDLSSEQMADILSDVRMGIEDAEELVQKLTTPAADSTQQCDLTASLWSAIRQLSPTTPTGVRVTAKIWPCGWVKLSSTDIRRLVTNLFGNSCDAMPSGGVISLTLRPKDGAAELRVSDTGTGIPEEVLDKVFDPYFSTKPAKGTGLGLHTVQEIMRTCGGGVHVESTPGEGSTFVLHFPLLAAPDALPGRGRAEAPVEEPLG